MAFVFLRALSLRTVGPRTAPLHKVSRGLQRFADLDEAAFLVSSARVNMFSKLHKNPVLEDFSKSLEVLESTAAGDACRLERTRVMTAIAGVLDGLGEDHAARAFASEAVALTPTPDARVAEQLRAVTNAPLAQKREPLTISLMRF